MTKEKFSVHQLGEVTVYNENSSPIQLSRLWSEKAAVIVFIRHFN